MGREDRSTTKRDASLSTRAARKESERRDGTGFVALPHVVIDSPGWRRASHPARSLVADLARAFNGRNNGAIWLSARTRKTIGWGSESTYRAALLDLIDCGLIVETRKGGRNLATWYGLTWRDLDVFIGLDIDPKHWTRGAYARPEKAQATGGKARTARATSTRKLASVSQGGSKAAPSDGAIQGPTAPSDGESAHTGCTVGRSSQANFGETAAPSDGEYLEACHLRAQRASRGPLPATPTRRRRLGLVLAQRIKHSINPAHRAAALDVLCRADLQRTATRRLRFIIPEGLK